MNNDLENLTPTQLKALVKRGILRVMENYPIPTTIEETPEYQKHAALRGQPIHISQASREYDIPSRTISRWVEKGYIPKLGTDGNKLLLDWSYVAYCAEVYQTRKGQGKWVFDENGLPYIPET